jgi:radical SAM superfamily enzyme YgiQ (UPF0313 family)
MLSKIPLKIYFADLTYNTVSVVNDVFPLNIGYVASYTLDKFGDSVDVSLFKYINELEDAIRTNPPDILALSHYTWNHRIDVELSRILRQTNLNSLIVWGGPDFPADIPSQEKFLKKYPEFDIYVPIEGEMGFANIVEEALNSKDSLRKNVLTKPIDGCISRTSNGQLQYSNPVMRLKNLDDIPSPYLSGLLDKFFQVPELSPMFQTNRGCPFACSYCVDGSDNVRKVNQFSTERLSEELEYIAKNVSKETTSMYISDLNFGMIPRDLEICEKIAAIQKKYDYPLTIQATTGKNNKERIIKAIKQLSSSIRLFMSVQSLNQDVLQNIKRSNISTDQMLALAPVIKEQGLRTYAEVILGLPGESYQSHVDTIHDLVSAKMEGIIVYSCLMLHGSELNTPSQRQKWELKTKYRLLHKAFTKLSDGKVVTEVEEVVVGSNTMSFNEYVELRKLAFITWTVGVGYFYDSIIRFLQQKNVDVFNLYHNALKKSDLPDEIVKIFQSFENHTKDELWDSSEELRNHYERDENYDKLLNLEDGINVVLTHHALIISKYMKQWNEFIISTAYELISQNIKLDIETEKQFQDVANYCRGLSFNILGADRLNTNPVYEFNYDVEKWLSDNNDSPLSSFELNTPQDFTFCYSHDQTNLIDTSLNKFGDNLIGIARLLSDIPIPILLRKLEKSD